MVMNNASLTNYSKNDKSIVDILCQVENLLKFSVVLTTVYFEMSNK